MHLCIQDIETLLQSEKQYNNSSLKQLAARAMHGATDSIIREYKCIDHINKDL